MVVRAGLLCAVIGLAGCAAHPAPRPTIPPGDEITLYRDRALIKQRVEVDVPPASLATLTVQVAAGTSVQDVVVLDRGALRVLEVRGDKRAGSSPDEASSEPAWITFVVRAPRPGRYPVHLGYVTDRLQWEAAYTVTTTAARSSASLRGSLAIRNTGGVRFARTRTFVVDAELGAWRDRIAQQLGSTLVGTRRGTAPLPEPRRLGVLDLPIGETRIELLPDAPPRRLRSVLVYDPIGTRLDHAGAAPIRDPNLGIERASGRVTESVEILRPAATSQGLPGGPVRLLERDGRGALTLLGDARLFDAATRVAYADTIAIGTAGGVTGGRERRELTIDDEGKRLVEEFVLTISNARPHPVEVVLREHLYRGQNWTLAYQTGADPRKEGPQQISMRTTVPANSVRKALYVVVYTWP